MDGSYISGPASQGHLFVRRFSDSTNVLVSHSDYDSVTPRELVTQAPDQRLRFQSPSLEGGSGLPKIGFKLRYR